MSRDLGPSRVRIRARPGWYLLALLVVAGLATRWFPFAHPTLTTGAHWGMAVAGVVLLADSILLHELAHTWVAARHGVPSRGVTFSLFGGQTELARALPTPGSEAMLALAGPAANLLLALVAWGAHTLGDGRWSELVLGVLDFTARVNVLLAILNLLPVLPLDGGRVVRAIAWRATGSAARGTPIAARVGAATCIVIVALGVLLMTRGRVWDGAVAILVALYLWRRTRGFLSVPVTTPAP